MARARHPIQLHHADHWRYYGKDAGRIFDVFDQYIDDETAHELRRRYFEESLLVRNRHILTQCRNRIGNSRKRRISLSSIVSDYFGGNADNIQRGLKQDKVTDEVLAYLMSIAGLHNADWGIIPHRYHCIEGLARTVKYFRDLCVSAPNPSLNTTEDMRRRNPEAHVEPPEVTLSIPHATLLFCVFREDDVLNEWLFLSTPFARHTQQLRRNDPMTRLLENIYAEALTVIASDDDDSRRILTSWAPTRAGAAVALERLAEAWNPFQLYWYLVEDTVRP